MLTRLRKRQGGFTLIELLIVVAIIGIIAALLIPNFLDALQKAKQKRTTADIRNVGTAGFSWLTDQLSAAAAGAGVTTVDIGDYVTISHQEMQDTLIPQYIQSIPQNDGWKNEYEFYFDTENPLAERVILIRSLGRDETAEGSSYTVGGFDPTDYQQDLVWADGYFIRWAGKDRP
jgi:type II secretion system protein G